MNLFGPYTYNWWQTGIFKLTMFAIGLAAGSYWSEFFRSILMPLILVAIVGSIYISYVSFRNNGK